MVDFRMPSLGADMEAGTLVEWMVKPGDQVKRGDVVAVVETQKGAIEIEIFETGQVDQILVEVGSKVPVGTPLARVRTEEKAKAGVAVPPAPAPPSPTPSPRCERRSYSGPARGSSASRRSTDTRSRPPPPPSRESRRPHDGLHRSAASISQRSQAADRMAPSCWPTWSSRLRAPRGLSRNPLRRRKPSASISMPCAPPSRRQWRGRSARFRTTIFCTNARWPRPKNGWRALIPNVHRSCAS